MHLHKLSHKIFCKLYVDSQEWSITLLNVVSPHNIIVRCWEFKLNLCLLVQLFGIFQCYEGPWKESCMSCNVISYGHLH